ncbi:MAG TPA: ATP-binding protein, partial [Bacteroidales bacterium]|nr:ATP-binding protein [Bacteroidales bacterium]
KYFSGFWDKYDLQITPCRPQDSVYVAPPEDAYYHCYNFFYEYVLRDGIQVPNTDFFYLDNLNGRISYFAAISYENNEEKEVTLFIELDSRLISEGLGYPELLLEDRYVSSGNEYSWAKYNRGRLITSSGDFAYSMTSKIYTGGKEGFEMVRFDKYDHLVYNIDATNTIIVSKPAVFWVDILISFSYIFSFFFIILILLLIVTNISPLSLRIRWNFKNKIQVAMTSLLFISLILIGAGTVYFSIRQYKSRQTELLEEKIQSVYVELIHKLEFETDLHNWSTDEYFNLNELLQKFSNVFYTDINLFDEDGQLLATSRPEIFNMGLTGNMMDALAYREMGVLKRSEFIHSERIGGLKYLSAYVPFVNSENKILAYLNLPYFTRQDELTREVTNLVVAIINIVVLLSLLSFTIAVFMSNRITHPLRLLQENIARISLSEINEKINYKGRDEIGSLVEEYNQMVDQLKDSAELLAQSERESAWREMAKQIAHEIKNPLTPMKLGVQHLQRIWDDHDEKTEEQVDKITRTLIQQINNLSAIATEFSNFAKMPAAKNVRLDLVARLKDTVSLFEEYDKFKISLNTGELDHVYIYADKEQLNRVLINLVKNAMQAFSEGNTGTIDVQLERRDANAIISVSDNGKGIPEDIRDRLFQPNFTTKSSGMGMGLAIVKNIVESAGGKIWYETELNKGTTFYVLLPLANDIT